MGQVSQVSIQDLKSCMINTDDYSIYVPTKFVTSFRHRVLAGKPKVSPFLVNWEKVVSIYSIFFII